MNTTINEHTREMKRDNVLAVHKGDDDSEAGISFWVEHNVFCSNAAACTSGSVATFIAVVKRVGVWTK